MTAVPGRPVLAWVLGLLVVGVLAVTAGAVVSAATRPSAHGDWAELGVFIAGAIAALAVAVVAWLVLLTVVVRRYVPAGRRLAAARTSLLVVVTAGVAVGGLAELTSLGGGLGAPAVGILAGFAAGAVAPPVVVSASRRDRTPTD